MPIVGVSLGALVPSVGGITSELPVIRPRNGVDYFAAPFTCPDASTSAQEVVKRWLARGLMLTLSGESEAARMNSPLLSVRPAHSRMFFMLRCTWLFTITFALAIAGTVAIGAGPSDCKEALTQHAVCESANVVAIDAMRKRSLEAVSVMQDVSTGALVVFAASEPSKLDVSTQVLPLSLSKVFLAASWWDHRQPDLLASTASEQPVNVHEMLVGGSDSYGRRVALALRKAVGTQAVLADFRRYGFNRRGESFWAEVDPQWKKRLTLQPAYARLDALNDENWSSVLSIGESEMATTALHVSRFFQAIGNNGLVCAPVARALHKGTGSAQDMICRAPSRMVEETTAKNLMAAVMDAVKRGSATRIAAALSDVGWAIGGKTGTGGRHGAPMEKQDGWFAGLVFDREGKARYTVATFVSGGGFGGVNAAEISAAVARFLAVEDR